MLKNEKSMSWILYKDWVGHYAEGHPGNSLRLAIMAETQQLHATFTFRIGCFLLRRHPAGKQRLRSALSCAGQQASWMSGWDGTWHSDMRCLGGWVKWHHWDSVLDQELSSSGRCTSLAQDGVIVGFWRALVCFSKAAVVRERVCVRTICCKMLTQDKTNGTSAEPRELF